MPNFTPRLEIYPQRIAENARAILALCHSHGIQVAAVTKVTAAHPARICWPIRASRTCKPSGGWASRSR